MKHGKFFLLLMSHAVHNRCKNAKKVHFREDILFSYSKTAQSSKKQSEKKSIIF